MKNHLLTVSDETEKGKCFCNENHGGKVMGVSDKSYFPIRRTTPYMHIALFTYISVNCLKKSKGNVCSLHPTLVLFYSGHIILGNLEHHKPLKLNRARYK